MVHRFRSAQSRQREARQQKIAAVRPHFDRFEQVKVTKQEMETSQNYHKLNNYIMS